MKDTSRIEYRVREIKRYVVTRWTGDQASDEDGKNASFETTSLKQLSGEYPNWDTAYAVAYALCKEEHERLGFPPYDTRIQYPVSVPNGTVMELDPAFHDAEEIASVGKTAVNEEGEIVSL